jgi:hypothetical protein
MGAGAQQKMKTLFVILLLTAVASAQETICHYHRAADVLTAYCTMADGSGVETTYAGDSVHEETYNAEAWAARLATAAKADMDYTSALAGIRAQIQTATDATSIHDKKDCRAPGFHWHHSTPQGWCSVN